MIAKQDLVHGAWYVGHCRNAEYAKWNGEKKHFVHWRWKFAVKYPETILHPEDDQVYDVFEPYEKVDKPDFVEEIEL